MIQEKDEIIPISPQREKFFGCSGRMLLPCPATISALIDRLPADKLITTEQLGKTLAAQFEVEVTCPVTTQKALKAIAKDASRDVEVWRVVKKNGELLASAPGGVAGQAERLKQAGFGLDTDRKVPKVSNLKASLARFD